MNRAGHGGPYRLQAGLIRRPAEEAPTRHLTNTGPNVTDNTRFARIVFRLAGIYGLLVMLPQYFLESRIGVETPPAITHPEYFYGFVGLAVVWQFAFLLISRDPVRYRPFMVIAVLEKLSFGLAAPVLYVLGRSPAQMAMAGGLDLLLGTSFVIAYLRTRTAGK